MNLTKYVTLNIISFISNVTLVLYFLFVICLEYNIEYVKIFSENFVLGYCFLFYFVMIFSHFLFIIELIIRKKWPNLMPEVNIPDKFRIVYSILFFIGWLFALYTILIGSSFLFELHSYSNTEYLPFEPGID